MEKKHSPVLLALLMTALVSPLQAAEAAAEPTTNAAQPARLAGAELQEAPCYRFSVGNRVRIGGPKVPGAQITGEVIDADSEGLRVVPDVVVVGAELVPAPGAAARVATRIPLSQIERIEVSAGKRSHAGTGALIGASIPAAFAFLGLILGANEHPTGDNLNGGYILAGLGAAAVAPAALLGAGLGALSRTERWEPACTKPLRLTIAPDLHGGARVGLAVRF